MHIGKFICGSNGLNIAVVIYSSIPLSSWYRMELVGSQIVKNYKLLGPI